MTAFLRNVTLALAWFWGGFVLLTEGVPGFVRMGEGLGYLGLSAGFALFCSLGVAVLVAVALQIKGLYQ